MKINFTKESIIAMSSFAEDKEYLKTTENFCNERLKFKGYLFLNEVLEALGLKPIKRGQLDGWIYDELDPERKGVVKFRMKVENGELILNLNEEKDIIDYVF